MDVFYRYRFVLVIVFLGIAAALLTDKNKLPLALRGLKKTLGTPQSDQKGPSTVSPARRWLAFLLILAAFVVAVI